MKATWKKGDFVVIKIDDDLYSLTRMATIKNFLFFYLQFTKADNFTLETALSYPVAFCCAHLGVLQKLGVRRIKSSVDGLPDLPEFWIKPNLGGPGRAFRGGRLIRCNQDRGPFPDDPVVQQDLDPARDLKTIQDHELTNLMDFQTIRQRLQSCHKIGRKVDPLKAEIFDMAVEDT